MKNEKKQYRQAFKATSLFGGVQVIQIIISMLKSKVIAFFLGPAGMGIYNLLRNTVEITGKISGFGLSASSVKFISEEFTEGNEDRAYKLIQVLQNLLWISGVVGAVILAIAAPFLSRLLFGSNAYTFSMIWLSSAVLFNQLADGRVSVLQSLRKLQYLAKANLWGSAWGLILTAPVFYFLREEGIVPAIIIAALINLFLSNLFLKKSKIQKKEVSRKESIREGMGMLKLGLALSFSSLISAATAFALQLYIAKVGGMVQVGLYSSGFLILDRYGGLIFTAMAKDFYPRLAGISNYRSKIRYTVEHQAFLAILLMTPFVVMFLALAPEFIRLLLSSKFIEIKTMVSWGMIGLLLKATSWSMAYIIIAKGDTKLYIQTNISFKLLELATYIIGFYLGGLVGLGISFMLYYLVYLIGIYRITYKKYKFYFSRNFYFVFLMCLTFSALAFGLTYLETSIMQYILFGLVFLGTSWFCYDQLNNKLDFRTFVKEFMEKRKNREES